MFVLVSLAATVIAGVLVGRYAGAALARTTAGRFWPFFAALAAWAGVIFGGAALADAGVDAGAVIAFGAIFALGGTVVGWSRNAARSVR